MLGFCRSFKGEALFWRMSNSFGYLSKEGYGGHVFPIVFGEVGSHLTAVRAHADKPFSDEGSISLTAWPSILLKGAVFTCHAWSA